MSDAMLAFLGSVLVGVLTLIGVIYRSKKDNDAVLAKIDKQSEISDARLDAKLEKYQAVTDEKISELRDEVRKHNGLIERTYRLEKDVALLGQRQEAADKRIAGLEKP